MRTEEFDYNLPEELIAQTPLEKRDESRLLVVDRKNGKIEHNHFKNIFSYLEKGDVLVLNDTKVLPARLLGRKEETNAHIELLMLKEINKDTWECLTKPFKRIKEGTIITFGDGRLKAICMDKKEDGMGIFKFIYEGIFLEILEKLGNVPLPPYINSNILIPSSFTSIHLAFNSPLPKLTTVSSFTTFAFPTKHSQVLPSCFKINNSTWAPVISFVPNNLAGITFVLFLTNTSPGFKY